MLLTRRLRAAEKPGRRLPTRSLARLMQPYLSPEPRQPGRLLVHQSACLLLLFCLFSSSFPTSPLSKNLIYSNFSRSSGSSQRPRTNPHADLARASQAGMHPSDVRRSGTGLRTTPLPGSGHETIRRLRLVVPDDSGLGSGLSLPLATVSPNVTPLSSLVLMCNSLL
jgi:hypothetical protein